MHLPFQLQTDATGYLKEAARMLFTTLAQSGMVMNVVVCVVMHVLMVVMVYVTQRSLSVASAKPPLASLAATLFSGRRLGVFEESRHGRRAGVGLRSAGTVSGRGSGL